MCFGFLYIHCTSNERNCLSHNAEMNNKGILLFYFIFYRGGETRVKERWKVGLTVEDVGDRTKWMRDIQYHSGDSQ